MNDFQFKNGWLGILLGIGCILPFLLYFLDQLAAKRGTEFISKRMALRLVNSNPIWRTVLSHGSLGAAGFFIVLALMRPQWGLIPESASRAGAEVMICLDVSRSMLAEDVAPNRLQRAKAEIRDLLEYLEGEQVGLMVFAGRPVMLSPLTSDFGFLKLVLDAAGPHTVGRGGTRLETAIQRALTAFQEADDVSKVVVLFTDGGETGAESGLAARIAKRRDVRLIIIGFGDETGTTIESTDPRTGERKTIEDQAGRPVVSRLDTALLRQLAEETEGVYIPAGTGTLDLADLHRVHFAPLIRAQHLAVERSYRFEGFQYPLALAMLCLFIAIWAQAVTPPKMIAPQPSRKTSFLQSSYLMAVCAIVMSFVTASGYADERLPSGPLLKSDQVIERFRQGVDFIVSDLEKARAIFEDIYRQPNSSQALRFQSKYNLGWIAACEADRLLAEDPQQALAQLELSREAFQDAVELNPGHIPTRQNLEVIALRAKQLRDAQEPKDNSASKELDQLTQRQRELNQEMDNQNKNDSTPGEEGQSGEQGATNSQAEGAPEEAKDAESQRPREDTEALTERQEELARKAEDLAEQMQREATPGPRDDAQDIAKDGVGEEAEDPQTEPKEAMAPEQAAQEIESAAKEMQQAASTAKKEGSNSRDAQNLRESALEKLEKARKLLGLEKEPNEAQPQEQEKEPEQQQEQGANDANQAAQTEQEMSGISQLLQLIRDREAQRMKDRGNGRWTVDEPVAEDW